MFYRFTQVLHSFAHTISNWFLAAPTLMPVLLSLTVTAFFLRLCSLMIFCSNPQHIYHSLYCLLYPTPHCLYYILVQPSTTTSACTTFFGSSLLTACTTLSYSLYQLSHDCLHYILFQPTLHPHLLDYMSCSHSLPYLRYIFCLSATPTPPPSYYL